MLYKLDEKAAVSKLAQLSHEKTKDIRYLRKRKNDIDFRISTEAFTLDAERDLIRKRNAIEKELSEATKSYRLKKKVEFIDKRIEEMNKQIEAMSAMLTSCGFWECLSSPRCGSLLLLSLPLILLISL